MKNDFTSLEVANKTLAAQVHERIRGLILEGKLPRGERIEQNKLADTLGVSLVPVREALKSLEAEGMITIVPRRGAFVAEFSLEHLDDLYWSRQIIEGEAVYYAADKLNDADIAAMRDLIEQMQVATDAQDIQQFMGLNRQFHRLIYECLGNQHLLQIITGLWERSDLYRYQYMFDSRNINQVHAEHKALVDALEDRDADKAKLVAMEHIRHTQIALHQRVKAELSHRGGQGREN